MTAVHDAIRPVETTRNGNLPKALIADDEPDMLRFLKSQLSTHYQIIEAVDGQQAIEKASQFLPDVILLDMMMPGLDGPATFQALRSDPETSAIPVVFLTAKAMSAEVDHLRALGARGVLIKPFDPIALPRLLRELLGTGRPDEE